MRVGGPKANTRLSLAVRADTAVMTHLSQRRINESLRLVAMEGWVAFSRVAQRGFWQLSLSVMRRSQPGNIWNLSLLYCSKLLG